MRAVDWGFIAGGLMLAAAIAAFIGGSAGAAGALVAAAILVISILTVWTRRHPSAMPYACRSVLAISPLGTSRIMRVLRPQPGEQLLEIGPGVGHHAAAVAAALLPAGSLEVIDVQQQMLDAVMKRMRLAGLSNVSANLADGSGLPFEAGAFDGAYMSAVLGEIPNRAAALGELHRVIRPGGRLVVAEVVIDPDYVALRRLIREASKAGFRFEEKAGAAIAYAARLARL